VVKPGRTFLRRIINLSMVAKQPYHHIRINREFRSDLQWWAQFLAKWNGTSMMSSVMRLPPSAMVTSDASGTWGCGVFTKSGSWFQLKWPQSWVAVNIVPKELLPVVLACAVWGRSWRGKTIRCNCDNAAVVAILKSGTCKDSLTMHLARSLFFFLAEFNVSIYAVYLPGEQNMAVDSLSRDDLPSLFQVVPTAS